jgi:hypothetical protein
MKPTHTELSHAHRNWQTAQSQAIEAWDAYYMTPTHSDDTDGQRLCALNRATAAQSRAVQAESVYRELKAKYNE